MRMVFDEIVVVEEIFKFNNLSVPALYQDITIPHDHARSLPSRLEVEIFETRNDKNFLN